MKPILTICPSRERPKRLETMLDSFYATSLESTLVVVVDKDDPTIEEYRAIHKKCHLFDLCETQLASNTERFNETVKSFGNFKYYHMTNDDVIYRTDQWDMHFMNILDSRPGIAFGNDLMMRNNQCTTPFISGDIVRALGWIQMPRLTHLYADNVWMILGKLMQSLFYMEGIVIEHMHPEVKKAEMDDVYRRDNSEDMYKHDSEAFFNWCSSQALKDVKRISEYINRDMTASP